MVKFEQIFTLKRKMVYWHGGCSISLEKNHFLQLTGMTGAAKK